MANRMTSGQRLFWEAVKALCAVTRRARNADLEAAADALELESQITNRLADDAALQQAVAEPEQTGGPANGG